MRKLASIQTITNLEPIEGADLIERATVEGWSVVVKKGEFKIGDNCVYCEIDSVFPKEPEYEFLASKHYRIKTIKLRGQVSQGICFPLSILDGKKYDTDSRETPDYSFDVGKDVTELLKIQKYEPPIPAHISGLVKGNFPGFLYKTDEERVQNIGRVLERHRGIKLFATEKLDGTSMSTYLKDGEFGVCSRNLELKETETNSLWSIARTIKIEDKLKSYGDNIAIQGELLGPGINGNIYKLNILLFRMYNVFDIKTGEYFGFGDFLLFAKDFGFDTVPIVFSEFVLDHGIQELLTIADGYSVLNSEILREGLVFRGLQEIRDPDLGRLSFKAISNKFLLKYGG
jgi:RNA ligase (TIGR02306 family)